MRFLRFRSRWLVLGEFAFHINAEIPHPGTLDGCALDRQIVNVICHGPSTDVERIHIYGIT
jgi:hypothetical protein